MSTQTPSDYLAAEVRVELARRGLSIAKFATTLDLPGVDHPALWATRRLGPSRNVDVTLEEASQIAAALGWELVDLIDSTRVLTSP